MESTGPFSRRPLEHQLRRGHHQRRQANRRVRGDGGETLSSFRPTAAAARETNIDAEKAERGAADAAKAFAKELSVLDDEQAAMMAEECILVDRCDRPTGSGSKVCIERYKVLHERQCGSDGDKSALFIFIARY